MRTTLDLPDDLYKRLEQLAVREGKPLREIVLRCLEEGLNRQATSTAQRNLPVVPEAGRRMRLTRMRSYGVFWMSKRL